MTEGALKDLGPCQVEFDATNLGATLGDVIFRYSVDSKPILEDQKGTTELDGIFVGATCEVEVPLSRTSLAILNTVVPQASISGSEMLIVDNPVGVLRSAAAKELVLKPIVDGVASESNNLTLYSASPSPDFEVTYNNDGQRVYKVIFKAYPDTDNHLFKIK